MEQFLAQFLSGRPGGGGGGSGPAASGMAGLAAVAVVPNHYAPMPGETFGGRCVLRGAAEMPCTGVGAICVAQTRCCAAAACSMHVPSSACRLQHPRP